MADIRIQRVVAIAAGCLCAALAFGWASMAGVGRAFTGGGDPWLDTSVPASSNHAVVVAELFTSEGCSSCPPADQVLSRLVREPVDGVVVLGLGEHVDYWDHLGWRDPFSTPAFSSRQSEYQGQVFRTGSIYTPQLVIDGQFEAVGSDVPAVRRAVATAAKIPKAALEMAAWAADVGHVGVHVRVNLPSGVAVLGPADVVVALTQDHLTSDVHRGENRGRSLAHSAVVRSLTAIGSLKPSVRTFEATATVPIEADWNLADVRMIGLLQERHSRRIVGAGSVRVNGHEGPPSAG
jgi:hypothetical protein